MKKLFKVFICFALVNILLLSFIACDGGGGGGGDGRVDAYVDPILIGTWKTENNALITMECNSTVVTFSGSVGSAMNQPSVVWVAKDGKLTWYGDSGYGSANHAFNYSVSGDVLTLTNILTSTPYTLYKNGIVPAQPLFSVTTLALNQSYTGHTATGVSFSFVQTDGSPLYFHCKSDSNKLNFTAKINQNNGGLSNSVCIMYGYNYNNVDLSWAPSYRTTGSTYYINVNNSETFPIDAVSGSYTVMFTNSSTNPF